jgi:Holliday junction DNA helicase RuvA
MWQLIAHFLPIFQARRYDVRRCFAPLDRYHYGEFVTAAGFRMIGRITGLLLEKLPPLVLVDVQGVGYEIDVPMSTFYHLPAIGAQITLHTHLVVREDVHLLFGFATEPERQAFRQLVKISGVGARTALALLSGLSVADLHQAVTAQDSGRLIKIPGIGKKTAERLLLELRDKLDVGMAGEKDAAGATPSSRGGSDVLNALLSLGYNDREASWAIKQLPADVAVSDGIRQALKLLSKEK